MTVLLAVDFAVVLQDVLVASVVVFFVDEFGFGVDVDFGVLFVEVLGGTCGVVLQDVDEVFLVELEDVFTVEVFGQ